MRLFMLGSLTFFAIFWCGFGSMTQSFPPVEGNVSISLADEPPAYPEDWPNGAYQIPHKNIYISTLDGNDQGDVSQVLCGLVGRGIFVSSLAGQAKRLMGDGESMISVDLNALTVDCLKKEIKLFNDEQNINVVAPFDRCSIKIEPYLIFSFIDGLHARIWVELRVKRNSENPDDNWHCHYLCGLGDPRSISGPDSWTSDGGKTLKAYILYNMETALWVMLMDFHGKLRTHVLSKSAINGRWIFYREPVMVNTKVFWETKNWDVVLPMVGDDAYFAGINIIPADFDEPQTQQ